MVRVVITIRQADESDVDEMGVVDIRSGWDKRYAWGHKSFGNTGEFSEGIGQNWTNDPRFTAFRGQNWTNDPRYSRPVRNDWTK